MDRRSVEDTTEAPASERPQLLEPLAPRTESERTADVRQAADRMETAILNGNTRAVAEVVRTIQQNPLSSAEAKAIPELARRLQADVTTTLLQDGGTRLSITDKHSESSMHFCVSADGKKWEVVNSGGDGRPLKLSGDFAISALVERNNKLFDAGNLESWVKENPSRIFDVASAATKVKEVSPGVKRVLEEVAPELLKEMDSKARHEGFQKVLFGEASVPRSNAFEAGRGWNVLKQMGADTLAVHWANAEVIMATCNGSPEEALREVQRVYDYRVAPELRAQAEAARRAVANAPNVESGDLLSRNLNSDGTVGEQSARTSDTVLRGESLSSQQIDEMKRELLERSNLSTEDRAAIERMLEELKSDPKAEGHRFIAEKAAELRRAAKETSFPRELEISKTRPSGAAVGAAVGVGILTSAALAYYLSKQKAMPRPQLERSSVGGR